MEEKINEFRNRCGQSLAMALHVESHLEFFIANYFIKPQNSKTHFFNDIILLKMNFEQKIRIFKEICKREEFDKEKVSKIVGHIRHVQKFRNKVAHWQSEMPSQEIIQLRKRTSFTTKDDILRLDEKKMKKLDDERLKAIHGITEFYLKYQKEGTIDDKPGFMII